jgi:hypothetical protein
VKSGFRLKLLLFIAEAEIFVITAPRNKLVLEHSLISVLNLSLHNCAPVWQPRRKRSRKCMVYAICCEAVAFIIPKKSEQTSTSPNLLPIFSCCLPLWNRDLNITPGKRFKIGTMPVAAFWHSFNQKIHIHTKCTSSKREQLIKVYYILLRIVILAVKVKRYIALVCTELNKLMGQYSRRVSQNCTFPPNLGKNSSPLF